VKRVEWIKNEVGEEAPVTDDDTRRARTLQLSSRLPVSWIWRLRSTQALFFVVMYFCRHRNYCADDTSPVLYRALRVRHFCYKLSRESSGHMGTPHASLVF